jgi:SAM-dependent methyltransferase
MKQITKIGINILIRKLGHVPWFYEGTLTFYTILKEMRLAKKFVQEKGRLLDIGCGSKPYQSLFNNSHYLGVDLKPSVYTDIIAAASSLPFKKKAFDTVLLLEVLEHVPNPHQVLVEIHHVLKDEGCLIISIPFTARIHGEPNDFIRLTEYGLKNLLSNKFRIVCLKERGGFILAMGQSFVFFLTENSKHTINRFFSRLLGFIIQLICVPLDNIFYYPKHPLGYFVIAVKKEEKS